MIRHCSAESRKRQSFVCNPSKVTKKKISAILLIAINHVSAAAAPDRRPPLSAALPTVTNIPPQGPLACLLSPIHAASTRYSSLHCRHQHPRTSPPRGLRSFFHFIIQGRHRCRNSSANIICGASPGLKWHVKLCLQAARHPSIVAMTIIMAAASSCEEL